MSVRASTGILTSTGNAIRILPSSGDNMNESTFATNQVISPPTLLIDIISLVASSVIITVGKATFTVTDGNEVSNNNPEITNFRIIPNNINNFSLIVLFTGNGPNWHIGDFYEFIYNNKGSGIFTIKGSFSRSNRVVENNVIDPTSENKDNIAVPIINILGQTTADNANIGDFIFTILDEFKYYHPIPPKDNFCGTFSILPNQVQKTILKQYCPKIFIVVKGKGMTLYERVENIFRKLGFDVIGLFLTDFYPRIIFYAMVKYILSRLLYGDFNIKFLLGKYNDKFLNDLQNSRFCGAISIFTDPNSIVFGYNKYFKFKL